MKAGQKSVGDNGLQNALFPIDVMYITQGSGGGFSHSGTYAIDFVGWNGTSQVNRYPYYAPFDCTLHRITSDRAGVEWRSDKEINTPKGKKKITLVCYHDNDVPNMKVGTKKKQGDYLGRTGTAGYVTGDHVHFEVFIQGQEWQRPRGMLQLWDSLYIDGTKIYNDFGYNWVESGSPIQDIEIVCKNAYLTMDEMKGNAQYIAYILTNEGWSAESIAGMLGNMQTESTINPCIWQNLDSGNLSLGFGLVQWTPATNLINWANSQGLEPANMDTQLQRILYELENGLQYYQTSEYPLSFREFTQSNETPEYLASAFLKNYERAGVEKESVRREQARYWYENLDWSGNWNGGGGGSTTTPQHDLLVLLLSDQLNGWKF